MTIPHTPATPAQSDRAASRLTAPTRTVLADLAPLVLRVVAGIVLLAHGAQKVFEFTPAGVATSFEQMGIPLAAVAGPVVAYLELVGGALLILGLGTRVVAGLLTLDMLGAFFLVHLSAGLFVDAGGYELVAMIGAATLALALAGPGRYSVDELFAARRR